jgi:predicted tellurium resistance membrane protein TerC
VRGRKIGIGLALVLRLGLLGTVAIIVQLTDAGHSTLFGQALLVARHDPDRRWPVPGLEGDAEITSRGPCRIRNDVFDGSKAVVDRHLRGVIGQILLLDIVFSIDSIITAVGMTDHMPIMVVAVIVAVLACCSRPIRWHALSIATRPSSCWRSASC